MKLELEGKEVAAIVLEYVQQKFPGAQFNSVTGAHYETIPRVICEKVEKESDETK